MDDQKHAQKNRSTSDQASGFEAVRLAHQSEVVEDYVELIAELIDQIEDVCPNLRRVASFRKSVAKYGDAYFFYNQAGEFCLLTDFLRDPEEIEVLI